MADPVLADVVADGVAAVDRRVTQGGDRYPDEPRQVRAAAAAVDELVDRLELGRFRGPVTRPSGKPQLLLRFDAPPALADVASEGVVLKVAGVRGDVEGPLLAWWYEHGVATPPVLACGDEPVSWLLLPWLPLEPVLPEGACDTDVLAATEEVAVLVARAHVIGCPDGIRARCRPLATAVGRHARVAEAVLRGRGHDPVCVDATALVHAAGEPVILHGDLGSANVSYHAPQGLLMFDARGYLGPREFDAARWSARVGQLGAVEILERWLAVAPATDPARAHRLLGAELQMEAGVRELRHAEAGWATDGPDPVATALLERARPLLAV